MPAINDGMQLRYSLVWTDRNGGDSGKVRLTVAGLAHLEEFDGTVAAFLEVVARLADRRASGQFDPLKVVEVVVPLDQTIDGLVSGERPLVDISDLIGSEPATWHNQVVERDGERLVQTSPFIRRFRGVGSVEDYLDRLRAFIVPPRPKAAPTPPPALALVQAFDYLDVVWRLAFKAQLVFVPNAERAARLAFPANTAEEFDNRLSALSEMMKGLRVPLVSGGQREWGPLKRMGAYLSDKVGSEGSSRVLDVVKTLQAVTDVRNSGQHVGVFMDGTAVTAYATLGLSFPVFDHRAAWDAVQAHVIVALDVLREEIRGLAMRPVPAATRSA